MNEPEATWPLDSETPSNCGESRLELHETDRVRVRSSDTQLIN